MQSEFLFFHSMNQQPRIVQLPAKKLVGKCLTMSFANNKTGDLWRNFMPDRSRIINTINNDLISLQIYEPGFFKTFDPMRTFEKWALVEVTEFQDPIPAGMKTFSLPAGTYAVFIHKGSSHDTSTFQYIFTEWLPASDFELDNRPHFEVLGAKYKNNSPDSEEEIWIPVTKSQENIPYNTSIGRIG